MTAFKILKILRGLQSVVRACKKWFEAPQVTEKAALPRAE